MVMQVREHVDYVAPDGTVYPLHVPARVGRWVMSQSGWGTPPLEYQTERGPFQHGESVRDYFLRPRIIQLLIRQQFCAREDYWTGRAALLNAVRPNRQALPGGVQPGMLRLTLPDGSRRSLDCYLQEGPRFEPRSLTGWDEWAFQEVLRFVAYNPVIYDPTVETATFTTDPNLVFPITFPIIFGGIAGELDVTYAGTWQEYPTITITGPAESPRILNQTTGETLALDYDVAGGEVVTINLHDGYKTVTNAAGTNLIGTVTPESDLGTFHLAPDPEAPGGVNSLLVTATATNVYSSIVLSWHRHYFGI